MNVKKEFFFFFFLLSPSLEGRLKPDEVEKIINKLNKDMLVITDDFYCALKGKGVKVIKEFKKGEEKKRITNFVDFYNKRFEFLRKLLEEKIDSAKLTSINKLSYGEAVVIGMVRESDSKSFVLEDSTGSVKCVYDGSIIEDEVIGIEGKKNKETFKVDRVIYPDIPLNKRVNTTEDDCHVLFTHEMDEKTLSRDSLKENHIPYIFTFDIREWNVNSPEQWLVGPREKVKKNDNKKIGVRLPSTVGIEGMRFFIFNFKTIEDIKRKLDIKDERKLLISLLKRRHLSPFEYVEGDPYLLKELPDVIFFTGGKESFFLNYKGISIISVTGEKDFILNLKTREFKEVS